MSRLFVSLRSSSFGWNPKEKMKEIFHKDGRLILVASKGHGDLLAFASFRFDVEPNCEGVNEDVLYLYAFCLKPPQ